MMTRGDLIKYGVSGKYYIVSFIVEETGTVIDYVHSDKEKAESHAEEIRDKHKEKYVTLMECDVTHL